jgi:hypothetical protein
MTSKCEIERALQKNWLTLEICGRRLVELVSEGAPVVGVGCMRSLCGVAQGVTVALACNKETHKLVLEAFRFFALSVSFNR